VNILRQKDQYHDNIVFQSELNPDLTLDASSNLRPKAKNELKLPRFVNQPLLI
jgi:hypothetical protein